MKLFSLSILSFSNIIKIYRCCKQTFPFLEQCFSTFSCCLLLTQFNACENCTSKQIDRKTELKARKKFMLAVQFRTSNVLFKFYYCIVYAETRVDVFVRENQPFNNLELPLGCNEKLCLIEN